MKQSYITTPIYYVNGDPHIGHAHTTIMGDILKRFNLLKGIPTFYTTGTDEHGQKNQEAIENSGMDPEKYLARQSLRFRKLFERLDINFDFFCRTTNENHRQTVQRILCDLYDRDLIYKKEYTGLYCVGCEQFKKPSDLDEYGRCPDHMQKPVTQTETNYFFKQSLYQNWLIEILKSRNDFIQPEFYRKEILSMLKEPLEDLCISRPKNRVWLGIELPFDKDYVSYIWFDALINYLSNINYGQSDDFDLWWNNSLHLMAKDIIKTHIIYWPIMLKAIGLKEPRYYRIHGYWVGEGGQKMSKSLGNVVEPNEVIDLVGTDAFRFYLAKNMGSVDSPISIKLISGCYNTDLANNIGNLHSRVLKFAKKRCNNQIPITDSIHKDDQKIQKFICDRIQNHVDSIDLQTIPDAVKASLEIADRLNLYFNDLEPWKMGKDPEKTDRFNSVIYVMLDSVRLLFEFLQPIMPKISQKALQPLGIESSGDHTALFEWKPNELVQGQEIGHVEALFPRLNV